MQSQFLMFQKIAKVLEISAPAVALEEQPVRIAAEDKCKEGAGSVDLSLVVVAD